MFSPSIRQQANWKQFGLGGQRQKYKTLLVAKRYTQTNDIGYEEIFVTTMRFSSIWLLLEFEYKDILNTFH